jgi:hypothetical protein
MSPAKGEVNIVSVAASELADRALDTIDEAALKIARREQQLSHAPKN